MARDIAKTEEYEISRKLRKKVEMLFAHLKRILGLGRLRLRGSCGVADEFHLAATAQNLRKLAKLTRLTATVVNDIKNPSSTASSQGDRIPRNR